MASRDPGSDDDESEDFASSGEDQLLRELAAAPRPDARTLAARALPELDSRLALAETLESERQEVRKVPEPGDVIDGRYRIHEVLGAGGMGLVFGAQHTGTGRKVALKWMLGRSLHRSGAERASACARFVREAKVAGRIRHPNVVEVYDAGVDPQAPYLVMEWLEGETLRACIERAAMPWEDALALLLPAMEGVVAVHKQGVIHRDLKPDNIFLAKVDGQVVPKVLDFGVSRLHGNESGEPSLTRTGMMIGTPAYMPLEQLRGEASADRRTDVYALGVVLYEMLTRSRPYIARNAADYAAVMASSPAIAVSHHRPELRGVREQLVMKALARAPEERFIDVEAFVRELSSTLAAAPKAASPSVARTVLSWLVALLMLAVVGVLLLRRAQAPGTPLSTPASASTRVPALVPESRPVAAPPALAPTAAQPSAPEAETPAWSTRAKPAPIRARPRPAAAVAPNPAQPHVHEQPRDATRMQADDFTKPNRNTAQPAAPADAVERGEPSTPKQPSLELGREQF